MSDLKEDLASLRFPREPESHSNRRWVGWGLLALLFACIGVAAWWWVSRERPIEVQTVTVSSRGAGTQAAVLNHAAGAGVQYRVRAGVDPR